MTGCKKSPLFIVILNRLLIDLSSFISLTTSENLVYKSASIKGYLLIDFLF